MHFFAIFMLQNIKKGIFWLKSSQRLVCSDSNPSKTARPLGHLTPLPMARKHCFYGILSPQTGATLSLAAIGDSQQTKNRQGNIREKLRIGPLPVFPDGHPTVARQSPDGQPKMNQ